MQHGGYADNDIAAPRSGPSEHSGDESINNLQSLPDKTRHCGDHSELKEAETQLFHHHRKDDRGDAVLQMIQCVTGADEPEGETLLLIGCIEDLRAKRSGSCRFCSWFIVHNSSLSWSSTRVLHFLYREQAPSVNGVKPETFFPYWPGLPSGLGVFAGV
jgi:hypothetical protein